MTRINEPIAPGRHDVRLQLGLRAVAQDDLAVAQVVPCASVRRWEPNADRPRDLPLDQNRVMHDLRAGRGVHFDRFIRPGVEVADGVAANDTPLVIGTVGCDVLLGHKPQRDPAVAVDQPVALDDRVARCPPDEDRGAVAISAGAWAPDPTQDIVTDHPAFAIEHVDAVRVIARGGFCVFKRRTGHQPIAARITTRAGSP